MDDAVRRAMAKWPDVPAVFGWLSLDRRGHWLLRGESIGNPALIEFIGRNYAGDAHGRWYFQNGPQRVFVALAYAPWVLRMSAEGLVTHTASPIDRIESAWLDQEGILVLETDRGAGIVDDRDIESLTSWLSDVSGAELDDDRLIESLERIQAGRDGGLQLSYAGHAVPLAPARAADIPARLGFVRVPQPLEGERGA